MKALAPLPLKPDAQPQVTMVGTLTVQRGARAAQHAGQVVQHGVRLALVLWEARGSTASKSYAGLQSPVIQLCGLTQGISSMAASP